MEDDGDDGILSGTKYLDWKRKRRNSLIGFILVGTVFGMDYSVVFSTLFLYLRDLVKTDSPDLYYGLILASFSVSSAIFGMICGRWLDKSRRVRLYVNVSIVSQMIGFLLYVIPYHPAFLLVGRFLCGTGDAFTSVITGEVFRIYDNKEGTRAAFWVGATYSFGFVIGPGISILFKKVDFKIGILEVNYLNFIGFFMIGALLIVLVTANFMIHDCSSQLDLKRYLKLKKIRQHSRDRVTAFRKGSGDGCSVGTCNTTYHSNENTISTDENKISISSSSKEEIEVIEVFKKLMMNGNSFLILIITFVFTYVSFAVDVLIPMIVVVLLKWDIVSLMIMFSLYGVFYSILLSIFAKFFTTSKLIYYASVICMIATQSLFVIMICLNLSPRNFTRDVCLILLFSLCWLFTWCMDDVLMKVILANIIPSELQSFAEGIRNGFGRVGTIIASLTTAFLLTSMHWWATGMLILTLFIFSFILHRRNRMIHAEEIHFQAINRGQLRTISYGIFQNQEL